MCLSLCKHTHTHLTECVECRHVSVAQLSWCLLSAPRGKNCKLGQSLFLYLCLSGPGDAKCAGGRIETRPGGFKCSLLAVCVLALGSIMGLWLSAWSHRVCLILTDVSAACCDWQSDNSTWLITKETWTHTSTGSSQLLIGSLIR